MPTKEWTKAELIKFNEHIYYEIEMLNHLANHAVGYSGFNTTSPPSADPSFSADITVNNALIESFATHARVLVEFLTHTKRSRHDNNVLAIDYMEDKETWIQYLTEHEDEMKRLKEVAWDRASEEMMHLCERRIQITQEQKRWAFQDLRLKINKHIKAFVENASDELLIRQEQILVLIEL